MTTPPPLERGATSVLERAPWSLRASAWLGGAAVLAMVLAPVLGSLDQRRSFTDGVQPGTDGTVHLLATEHGRQVDVQLVALGPLSSPGSPPSPSSSTSTVRAGGRTITVRLRLVGSAADVLGCHVELRADGRLLGRDAVPGTPPCGSRRGPGDETTVIVAVTGATRPTQVRVMWDPPAYAALPAV